MSVDDLRGRIDDIDDQLLELLDKRAKLVRDEDPQAFTTLTSTPLRACGPFFEK